MITLDHRFVVRGVCANCWHIDLAWRYFGMLKVYCLATGSSSGPVSVDCDLIVDADSDIKGERYASHFKCAGSLSTFDYSHLDIQCPRVDEPSSSEAHTAPIINDITGDVVSTPHVAVIIDGPSVVVDITEGNTSSGHYRSEVRVSCKTLTPQHDTEDIVPSNTVVIFDEEVKWSSGRIQKGQATYPLDRSWGYRWVNLVERVEAPLEDYRLPGFLVHAATSSFDHRIRVRKKPKNGQTPQHEEDGDVWLDNRASSWYDSDNPAKQMFSYAYTNYIRPWLTAHRRETEGEASKQAAESVRFTDINTVMYVKDFLEIMSLAKGFTSSIEVTVQSGKRIVDSISKGKILKEFPTLLRTAFRDAMKGVSAAYLAEHYGIRLSIRDTEELAASLDSLSGVKNTQTCGGQVQLSTELETRGRSVLIGSSTRLKAIVDSFTPNDRAVLKSAKAFYRTLLETDVLPTASNLWDMVPWSFVLDWFLPIGDTLEIGEVRQYLASLPLHYGFYSHKLQWTDQVQLQLGIGRGQATFFGNLSFDWYQRRPSRSFTMPEVKFNEKGVFDTMTRHGLEAAALVISVKG